MAVSVIIVLAVSVDRVDMKTFVNLIGAQLLGPALSAGAIYVASVLRTNTDILCIKGNLCSPRYNVWFGI